MNRSGNVRAPRNSKLPLDFLQRLSGDAARHKPRGTHRFHNKPNNEITERLRDRDQINGQMNTKPRQSQKRFFRGRMRSFRIGIYVTFLRFRGTFGNVISERPRPSRPSPGGAAPRGGRRS